MKFINQSTSNLKNKISLFFLLILTPLSIGILSSAMEANTLKKDVKESYFISIDVKTTPKYGPNFENVDYVNPQSPIFGKVILSKLGNFDNLNIFIPKGYAANEEISLIYDTLLKSSKDEIDVSYGLVAEKIFYDDQRSWVGFKIRKEAVFHDGKPITAEDVVWTFNTITTHSPRYKWYYNGVKKAAIWGKRSEQRVKFIFKAPNNELPFILGQLPVLPKHYWKGKKFNATTLKTPLGSGPYRIKNLSAGSFIELERVKDYWGNQVPIAKGHNRFAIMRFDYYRNQEVIREALKSGKISFFRENSSKNWALSYNIEAVRKNWLIKEQIKHSEPTGLQGLFFNIRKKKFQNPKVRLAINYAFDFEWLNKTMFFGSYQRANSYFNNSEFATRKLPNKEELKILNQYRGKIPEEVFTKIYHPPKTDGSGNNRSNLRIAKKLLTEAGWKLKNNVLTSKSGEKLEFEIIIASPAFERILQPFVNNLKKLGIQAYIKLLNPSQFQNRVKKFDFDLVSKTLSQSRSPGNEQYSYWGSQSADLEGSQNYIGIKNPVIDQVIKSIVTANSRKDLITYVKVLDRILLWNHYVIPQWYFSYKRILYWNFFDRPKTVALYDPVAFNTWWIDLQKYKNLEQKVGSFK